jgi:CBS domain containing-hemolysin-like protein
MPTGNGNVADLIGILLVLVLFTANGFFVAAEFSLVAVRRTRVAELVAGGWTNAKALHRLVNHERLANDSHWT